MSLFGSLFTGVAGLKAQSSRVGVISDNVSNSNTTGFKQTNVSFETLVNNTASRGAFNPGGVLNNILARNDRQGLLQSTDSATDIAISGSGFFVVNTEIESDGDVFFTRAGDYQVDAQGNFRNSAGFYLQAWQLDRDGRLPGAPGNLDTTPSSSVDSLTTVNIEESAGTAAATTNIRVGANLDSTQEVYEGAGELVAFTDTLNQGISADDVIVPDGVAGPPDTRFELGDTLDVTTDGITYSFVYGGFSSTAQVEGGAGGSNISFAGDGGSLVTTTAENFFGAGAAPTGVDAQFTIQVGSDVPITFTYKESGPNPFNGEFNDLETLANAMDEATGINARVVNDGGGGSLWFAAEDANESLTWTNGNTAAVDWIGNLDGSNGGFGTTTLDIAAPGVGANRFASLQDLANKVNLEEGITAVIEGATGEAQLTIRTDDPLADILFGSTPIGTTILPTPYAVDAMASAFGLDDDATAGDFLFEQSYDPLDDTKNMASGNITPQFTITRSIFDSLGGPHNLTLAFLKTDTVNNTWAVEVYAEEGEISGPFATTNQIAFGNIVFNGDGTLRSVDNTLLNEIDINWVNGSLASEVEFDWGDAGQPIGTVGATVFGQANGVSQSASDYNVAFFDQNGAEVGSLVSVSIDEDGFVFANYSNGESEALYKIPIADFSSPNNLSAVTGNVWFATEQAGELNLREAGTNGVGDVFSGVLENSNVELSDELTNIIIAQRSYQANSQIISTSDELLEELVNLSR